ncbi:DUF6754 domain-containing protein [Thermoproteota archaeon]
MALITEGLVSSLILTIVFFAIILISIMQATEDRVPKIKSLAALDAIREAVGRAAEMGRPVFVGTDKGGLLDQYAPHTLAGLAICGYTAEICAELGTPVYYLSQVAHVIPAATLTLKEAYIKKGQVLDEDYAIRYVSESDQAYATACLASFDREKPGACIYAGAWFGNAIKVPPGGRKVGAINIGAAARMYGFIFFVAACDYTLIGEELWAAGAYLSKDFKHIGALRGQDILKFAVLLLLLFSLLLGQTFMGALNA